MPSVRLDSLDRKEQNMDAFERAHFMFAQKNRCHIGILVTLQSPLSLHRLKEGVYLLKKRHFLLRSFIKADLCSFQETDTLPRVLSIQKDDKESWQSILNRVMNQSFMDLSAPLFRVFYFYGKGENGVILLMHHAIGDGTSLIMLVQEILSYAIHKTLSLSDAPDQRVSVEHLVLKELSDQKWDETWSNSVWSNSVWSNSVWSNSVRKIAKKQGPYPLIRPFPFANTEYICKTVDTKEVNQFLNYIRHKKLTFQSAFSAIVLKELFHAQEIEQVYYTCPINIRKWLGIFESTVGCQITLLNLLIHRKQTLSCESLSRLIHFNLHPLTHDRSAIFQNIFNLCFGHSENEASDIYKVGVSNLGTITLSDSLKSIGIQSMYISGSLGNKFAFHPIVCTLQNRMHITFCFSPTVIHAKQAQILCDQIIDAIQRCASTFSTPSPF